MPDAEEIEPGGAGRSGLAGYEYQIDVSVWLALQLLVANKMAHELILEPPSQEDLEAEVEESEPERVTDRLHVDSYVLVVQVKLRKGDAWTVSGIKNVLEYGSGGRVSAATRLGDSNVRYLLVTSAALNGGARGLFVRKPAQWPKPEKMPASISNALPAGAAGRVAVIGGEDEERLSGDIKSLLIEFFKLPNAKWEDCRDALREMARVRTLGGAEGRLRREDVEAVIRNHEGYLASSQELEQFVKPTNWSELTNTIVEKHAALIIGQSGTGKTLATQVLYEELRQMLPGLTRVKITQGPGQVEADTTPPPVLFDIEDPWGRFDLESETRTWSGQLSNYFARATHDHLYVATTRKDVAERADVLRNLRKWQVPLEAEHYGGPQRLRLYETRVPALPWELQLPVVQAKTMVLKELATPLEIQKFFDAVATIDRQRYSSDGAWIEEAIRTAHENSIESTVVEQIEHSDYVAAAAIVWALLKVADKFSYSYLLSLELDLEGCVRQLERGVTPLVQFFVAARNLRQSEQVISYYHPRVEAGVERALQRNRVLASKTLKPLITLWISRDGATERGAGKASALLAAIPKKIQLSVRLAADTHSIIDTWLEERLADPTRKLEEDLRIASAAGSRASAPSEVARYLLSQENRRQWNFLDQWTRPIRDERWYERHRSDPRTQVLIGRFIREVLPLGHRHYDADFAQDVKRLVPELSDAFLAAAHQIVGYGVVNSDGAIAEGALDDLSGFDSVLDEAFVAMTPTAEEMAKREVLNLALINGEYSDEYAEHVADNDDGYTADQFVKAFVRRVRETVGWQHMLAHSHRDRLRAYWLQELLDEVKEERRDEGGAGITSRPTTVQPNEVDGLFNDASNTEDEGKLWYLLNYVWDERYRPALLDRTRLGHTKQKIRLGALTCLIEHSSNGLQDLWTELSTAAATLRLVEIALDLARLRYERAGDWKDHALAASAAAEHLPIPFREQSSAFLEILNGRSANVTEPLESLLQNLDDKTEDIRRIRLAVCNPTGNGWTEDLQWILDHSEDRDACVEAVEAAERAELGEIVEGALRHKFAAVRAKALLILGKASGPQLSSALLRMVSDRGNSVRSALGQLLDLKVDPAHIDTLMQLANDKYSTGSHYVGNNAILPIARMAVTALEKYGAIAPANSETLKSIAISTDDPTLRNQIFGLIATNGGTAGLTLLFELATNPGRSSIRIQAARGLLRSILSIPPELVARITPESLETQISDVAAALTLVLGVVGSSAQVREAANSLAASPKRRALLVLLVRARHDVQSSEAADVAKLLPDAHPALQWCFGGEIDWKSDENLSDLGDPATCRAVFRYMES